jgi:hypothetical protein
MATLRPFRDYDEKDVINLYALNLDYSTITSWDTRIAHGRLVKLTAEGWKNDHEIDMIGTAGDMTIAGIVHERYGVKAKVDLAGAGDAPLGMTLFHIARLDENGEQLKFNPRKASELEAVIEGQPVPLVTRGLFLIEDAALAALAPDAGTALAADASGGITVWASGDAVVGKTLGKAAGDLILIKLEL